ncbi:MAG: hypothetical protein WAV15_03230 [Minisyncoccia bacterium]
MFERLWKNKEARAVDEALVKKKVFHGNVAVPSIPGDSLENFSPDLERSIEHNIEMFLGPLVSGKGEEIPVLTRRADDGKISQEMVAHAEVDFESGEIIKFTGKGLDNPKRETKVTFFLALGPYDTAEIAYREQFNRKGKGYMSFSISSLEWEFQRNWPQLSEKAKRVLEASVQRYNSKSGAQPPDPKYFKN